MFTADSSTDVREVLIQMTVGAECHPHNASPPGERAEINRGDWRREEEDSLSDQTCSNNDDDDDDDNDDDERSDGEDSGSPEQSEEEDPATEPDHGGPVSSAPAGRYAAMPLPPAKQTSAGSEDAGEDTEEEDLKEEGSASESRDGDQDAEDIEETGEDCQNREGISSAVARMPPPSPAGSMLPRTGPVSPGSSRHHPDTGLDLTRIFTSVNKASPELSLTPQTIDISGAQPAVAQVPPASWPTAVSPSVPGMSLTASLNNPPVSQSLQRSEASCVPWSSSPEVLPDPQTVSTGPAQTAPPFRENRRTHPFPIDRSSTHNRGRLSSDVDIDSVLNSSQKCSAGAFELSHSVTVGQDSGERPAASDQSAVADSQTHHPHEEIKLQAMNQGVSSAPPAPNPTQLPSIHPLYEGDGLETSQQAECGGQTVPYTPLNLDNIRRAVEKSPWSHHFKLSPCPTRTSPQPQRSMSQGSSQESGFSTDKDLASSTDSGLEKLALTHPPFPTHPDHPDPQDHLVPSGSPLPHREFDLGLLLTSCPAEGSLSDSSPDAHEDEGCGSPSQYPLLHFEYKPAVNSRSSNGSQHTSVRL